jgi:uncharacterized membrane protein YoaK (UPF0700 family)
MRLKYPVVLLNGSNPFLFHAGNHAEQKDPGGEQPLRIILPPFLEIFFRRKTMLLLLTLAAGSMDAISYLGLGHVFTAMMTGNTVFLGLSIGQGRHLAALRGVTALLGFSLGVAAGAVIVERKPRGSEWPESVTWALAAEVLLLLLFVWLWHFSGGVRSGGMEYSLIALSALAMGIQSAAVGYLGVTGITTTYITGTLTTLMVSLFHLLRPGKGLRQAEAGGTGPVPVPRPPISHIFSLAAVVFFYGTGAFVGTVLQDSGSLIVESGFPALAVALVVINALLHRRIYGRDQKEAVPSGRSDAPSNHP